MAMQCQTCFAHLFGLKVHVLLRWQVPQDVREARRDELVSLQQHVGQDFAESLVGRQVNLSLDLSFVQFVLLIRPSCSLS